MRHYDVARHRPSERQRIIFSLESTFLNATAEFYATDDDYITK